MFKRVTLSLGRLILPGLVVGLSARAGRLAAGDPTQDFFLQASLQNQWYAGTPSGTWCGAYCQALPPVATSLFGGPCGSRPGLACQIGFLPIGGGPTLAPLPDTPRSGNTPSDVFLPVVSFGEPFPSTLGAGFTVIEDQAVAAADSAVRQLLEYDPTTSPKAAFRYKQLLYGIQSGETTPASSIEDRVGGQAQGMAYFYGDDERKAADAAERLIVAALQHAPGSSLLQSDLLDLYYDRAVAELLVAKDATNQALTFRFVYADTVSEPISQEIVLYGTALGACALSGAASPCRAPTGSLAYALDAYTRLLHDRFGIDPVWIDPSVAPGVPFGHYLFQKLVPARSKYAATFIDGGVLKDVVTLQPATTPANQYQLSAGYKDLILVLDGLRAYARAASDLATLFLLRGCQTPCAASQTKGDLDTAKALILEAQQRLYVDGEFILGVFDSSALNAAGPYSGLTEAKAGYQAALGSLRTLQAFLAGNTNPLGFSPDFLMLMASDGPSAQTFDTLRDFLNPDVSSSPLGRAVADQVAANTNYKSYRGTVSDLSTQLFNRRQQYDTRLQQIAGAAPDDHPKYDHPESNSGSEIAIALTSIQSAANRVQFNQTRMDLNEQQQKSLIEARNQDLKIYETMADLQIKYGDYSAQLDHEMAFWSAAQDVSKGIAEVVLGSFGAFFTGGATFGLTVGGLGSLISGAAEFGKADIQARRDRYSAQLQASLLTLQGQQAEIKWDQQILDTVRQRALIALDSDQAMLTLQQETQRLQALSDEKAYLEGRRRESDVNLATSYQADPIHRLEWDSSMTRADESFRETQKWIFYMLRAGEYKWNDSFSYGNFTSSRVFSARTGTQLKDLYSALKIWDQTYKTSTSQQTTTMLSLRKDIFGYKETVNGVTAKYADPSDPTKWIDARSAFRSKLTKLTQTGGAATPQFVVIDFNTALDNLTDFNRAAIFCANGKVATPGWWLDKIQSVKVLLEGNPIAGFPKISAGLVYGGTSLIRQRTVGAPDPNDAARVIGGGSKPYATSLWYFDTNANAWKDTALPDAITLEVDGAETDPDRTTFQERSVAATDWQLVIPLFQPKTGLPWFNINQLDDIVLRIKHSSLTQSPDPSCF